MVTFCYKKRKSVVNMNYLTNAIDNYINSPEPYALQIDGSWGIGKTYFITNYAREITEINNIYFSLYGYNDLETLKRTFIADSHKTR
ncbi:MAG: P-loop NTPase fold protein [Streptococcus sp.]